MQAYYVFRALRTFRNLADRNRRRIGRKNSTFFAVVFNISNHLLLQFHIFKYGFNHNVYVLHTGVIKCACQQ